MGSGAGSGLRLGIYTRARRQDVLSRSVHPMTFAPRTAPVAVDQEVLAVDAMAVLVVAVVRLVEVAGIGVVILGGTGAQWLTRFRRTGNRESADGKNG